MKTSGLLLSFDLSGISMDRHLYIGQPTKNNPLSFIGEGIFKFCQDVLRQVIF